MPAWLKFSVTQLQKEGVAQADLQKRCKQNQKKNLTIKLILKKKAAAIKKLPDWVFA